MSQSSRSHISVVVAIALFFLSLLLSTFASAQPPSTVSDVTSVVLVEVPVQVLRKAEPVRGLQAEDFVIYDRGDVRPISDFQVVDLTRTTGVQKAHEVDMGGRRHLLLFFDLANAQPSAVQRAVDAARNLVANALHPSDLVAVGAYSPVVGARLPVSFTPDRAHVEAALSGLEALVQRPGKAPAKADGKSKRAKKRAKTEEGIATASEGEADPLGLTLQDQRAFATRMGLGLEANQGAAGELLASGTVLGGNAALHDEVLADMERFYQASNRNVLRDRALDFLEALATIADQLSAVRGQKHFLLFSEGVDGSFLEEAQGGHEMRLVAERFRQSGWLVQAIDTGGLATEADALISLSRETGGRYHGNANDLTAAMGEVLESTSLTYVLSFQADDIELDGTFHPLEVKLQGEAARGADLHYRPGYYAPRPASEQPALERNLRTADLLLSNEEGGTLGARALAVPFPRPDSPAHVPVLIEIEGDPLLALREGYNVGVEVYAYALDESGTVADLFVESPSIELTPPNLVALRLGGIKLYGELALPPGSYRLRVLVRDPDNGQRALGTTPFTVPENAATPTLLPPLFPDTSPPRWVYLRTTRSDGTEPLPFPFTFGDSQFMPQAKVELEAGTQVTVCVIGHQLPEGTLRLAPRLLDASGQPLDTKGRLALTAPPQRGPDGSYRLMTRLDTSGLAPGTYDLAVALLEPESGLRVESMGTVFHLR